MNLTTDPIDGATRAAAPTLRAKTLRLALPKGRQQAGVERLFQDAGITLSTGARGYRPTLSLERVEAKLLKPQNVVGMLAAGARDVGFCGADWVAEAGVDLVRLLDLDLDPVRLIAAAPPDVAARIGDGGAAQGAPQPRPLIVASEYARLAADWIAARALDARVLKTFGATEVFPPEDADVIVDNSATGATLRANGLVIIDEVMRSTTGLYAAPAALEDRELRPLIDDLVLCLRAVLDARLRVMLELNVDQSCLDRVLDALPCMRQPTIAPLRDDAGFAVRAAVPRAELTRLMPRLKALGATDLVVSPVSLLVP
ncbi:MAG: ATP phosphoribosyltransferase [Planctomycetota bacterium]